MFRKVTPKGKPFCHRCWSAAIFAVTDPNEQRAEEDWYAYQIKIAEVDKSELTIVGDERAEICRHCGYPKKLGDDQELFNVTP